jgi:hypothetical protein
MAEEGTSETASESLATEDVGQAQDQGQETVLEGVESEQSEMTAEESFEFSKLSPAAQKEFQKLQQERATLARQNQDLIKDRRAPAAEKPPAGPSKLETLRKQELTLLDELEKLGDDIPSASMLAKINRVQGQIREQERQEASDRESALEQNRAAERAQVEFEQGWKRANPTVAAQYNTILEQSRIEVERRNPGLDPNSMQFSAKWEARMEVMTEAAKAKVGVPGKKAAATPPPRNPAGARPAGDIANPVGKPGAPEKIDFTKPVDPQKVQWTV